MDRTELLKTHHRDPKTGRILKVTPYRAIFKQHQPTIFIKDGKHYFEDGTPVDPSWELKEAEQLLETAKAKLDVVKQKTAVKADVKEKKDVKPSTTVDHEGLQRKGQDKSSKPGDGPTIRDLRS